jgi:glycosyltransferase involved in cell wall biosynthesis
VRIAIVGTRGIPARYGGFETFAEELSRRLAQRGHIVSVYCREPYEQSTYLGVRRRQLPTIKHKYLDTLAHTGLSTLHLLLNRVDVALYCNAANAIYCWLPRLAGMPVALNVDGLERHRKKWNALAKAWYALSERLATFTPNEVVTDALAIQDYYRDQYRRASTMIPYGAEPAPVTTTDALSQLGLERDRYVLYVSRMEPENNGLLVREAFERLSTDFKLALIGDAPYAEEYIRRVRDTKDPRVVLPGAIYGQGYAELQSHCYCYVHATEVGGTHPALIEAMGRGALVLYLENPENTEVAGGAGLPFQANNLTDVLRHALALPPAERQAWQEKAVTRVRERYSWEAVTSEYEKLFRKMKMV